MSNNAGPKPPPPPPPKKPGAPPPPRVKSEAPPASDAENPFAAVVPAGAADAEPAPAAPASVPPAPPSVPPAPPAPEPVRAAPAPDLGGPQIGYPALGGAALLGETDDEAIKKINKHMSPVTKVVSGLLALLIVGIGIGAFVQNQRMEHRMDRVEEIGRMTDRNAMLSALRTELTETRYSDVKIRIMRNLGYFRDAQAVPALVAELPTAGPVRREAAHALALIGLPAAESAKQPLLDVLPRTDARDRAQVVWTLAVLREGRAADAIVEMFSQGRLQYLDGFDPKIIVEVIGPDRLKTPALTNHSQAAVRVLTAHALAEVANASVVQALASMIETELARPDGQRSEEVIRSAAAGLGRTGAREAARPLFNVLTTQRSLRQGVLDALGKSAAAPQLAVLLGEANTTETKKEIATLLAATHDARAADPLARLLTDTERDIRAIAAFGLAQLADRRAMPVLLELGRITDNEAMRRQAFLSLRLVSSAESTAQLVQLMRDVPAAKTDVLRALGKSHDPSAARVLVEALDSDDAQAAALALGDLNEDSSFQTLLRKAMRPGNVDMGAVTSADRNPANETMLGERKAAIIALGRFGRSGAVDMLMGVVEDAKDDFEIRALASASIGQVATDDQMRVVLGKIRDAAVPAAAREYYVQALWQQPRPVLNSALMDILTSDASPELKRAAGLAIGFSANPENDARLVQMLDPEGSRRAAAFAIALGGGEEAVTRLVAKLHDDADLKEVFRAGVSDEDVHWFEVLTPQMFDTGAAYRRLRAAWQLKEGQGDDAHSYVWDRLVTVFEQGYDGPGGATVQYIRDKLWTALSSNDETTRLMAARILLVMKEYGILLRGRDAGGDAERTVRQVFAEEAARNREQ